MWPPPHCASWNQKPLLLSALLVLFASWASPIASFYPQNLEIEGGQLPCWRTLKLRGGLGDKSVVGVNLAGLNQSAQPWGYKLKEGLGFLPEMARDVRKRVEVEEQEQEDDNEEVEEDDDEDDDDDEEEMVLDELGRVPGGMLPDNPCYPDFDYSFRSISNFVDASHEGFEKLVKDSSAAFTARQQQGKKYSSGETYWMCAAATPRTALEKLAKAVFDFHTAEMAGGADYDAERSGAEWWTLVLEADDDVGLHWDRDYALEGDSGILVHPHIATVTYLTGAGGPTIGLDRVSPMQKGPSDELLGPVHQAGKHISFDGRLLHGAPADANAWRKDGDKSTRVTFLVNVWLNHKPSTAEPFPEDKLKLLHATDVEMHTEKAEDEPETVDVRKAKAGGASLTSLTMPFKLEGKVKLVMPLPLEVLRAQTKEGMSFQLAFEGFGDEGDGGGDGDANEEEEEDGEKEGAQSPKKGGKRQREEKAVDAECVCEIVQDRKPKAKQTKTK